MRAEIKGDEKLSFDLEWPNGRITGCTSEVLSGRGRTACKTSGWGYLFQGLYFFVLIE